MDRRTMSPTARSVLEMEEINGARVANVIRYALATLIAIPLLVSATDALQIRSNMVFLGLYLGFTVWHTILLRKKSQAWVAGFAYFTILFDCILVASVSLYYGFLVSPDNFAHVVKNPSLQYLILPLALTILQFRLRLLAFAISCVLLILGSFLTYGLASGMPRTLDWNQYLLGPAVIVSDAATRPVPYLCLALIMAYASYRAVYMVRRIGDTESRRASLARFFSPDVVEELSAGESALGPGVRQKVTILFSDIRNFTRMSEGMTPDTLAAFLTDFRSRMTNAIFQYGGTVDKFVGDAIMATFGTPRPSPTPGLDSKNAVSAGLAMKSALAEFNRERSQAGLSPVDIGIGIHTGEVFCGTIGSEGRMEYTVIGDAVNTASRIESLCKKLGSGFLISEDVMTECGAAVTARRMPLVRVKGKEMPLRTFAVDVESGALPL
ncbi:MAG: adenylate/guanylate cyclase domain-containing protein [Spirochaetia bacterium]|nr:adenylate/guanylate cyclase domain-containing protein [Spirochaetia bacterium]